MHMHIHIYIYISVCNSIYVYMYVNLYMYIHMRVYICRKYSLCFRIRVLYAPVKQKAYPVWRNTSGIVSELLSSTLIIFVVVFMGRMVGRAESFSTVHTVGIGYFLQS